MKKQFKTVVDSSVLSIDTTMFVSAGKIGYQVELKFSDLQKVIPIIVSGIAI